MADDLGEKTEMPTAHRRREARMQGQVVKSQDLTSAVELAGAVMLVVIAGGWAARQAAGIFGKLLEGDVATTPKTAEWAQDWALWSLWRGAVLVAPFLIGMVVIAAVTNVLQTGWLVSVSKLQPKLNKLDPLQGAKRLFGLRNTVKTGVNIAKVLVVGTLAVLGAMSQTDVATRLPLLGAPQAYLLMLKTVMLATVWLFVALFVLAIVDYVYQRWQHTQDLKMTKQQVKEERKSMEGDAEMKARRMRMARQIMLQQLNRDVPRASVVVTNPTHFAVALRYEAEESAAPVVTAKGADFMAFRIREIAQAHDVPVIENPPLARALYANVDVGRQIDPEYYQAVAEILAYVYRLERQAA